MILPTTRVLKWLHLSGSGNNGAISQATIEGFADRYDAIVLNLWDTDYLAWIKAQNPDCLVLAYICLSSIRTTAAAGVDFDYADANHPEWFALTQTGVRKEWSGYGGHWSAAIWDTNYQDYWVTRNVSRIVTAGFDGCFADNDFYRIQWYWGTDYVQGDASQAASDTRHRNAFDDLIDKAGAGFVAVGKLLVPNISNGNDDPTRWTRHAAYGGGFEEFFGVWPGNTTITGTDFTNQMQSMANSSGITVATIQKDANTTAAQLRYSYAGVAIRSGGVAAWCTTAQPYSTTEEARFYSTLQDIALGTPLAAGYELGGCWVRRFSERFIALNPTASPITLTLPIGVTDSGGVWLTSTEVPAYDAVILYAETPRLFNNAEGAPGDETSYTVENSGVGSGDAWDVVVANAVGVFDNARAAHGSYSYRHSAASSLDNYGAWTTKLGDGWNAMYGRVYAYWTANPSSTKPIVVGRAGAGNGWRISIDSTGHILVVDANTATVLTSTGTVALNAWNRIEWYISPGTAGSTGAATLRVYTTADSSTPAWAEQSVSGQNFGGATNNITQVRFGIPFTNVTTAYWLDDIAVDSTGWVGPVLHSAAGTVAAISSSSGAVGTTEFSGLAGQSLLSRPTGWEGFTPLDVSAGGVFTLDNATDYLIQDQTVPAALRLRGGRKVVVMGVTISVDEANWTTLSEASTTGLEIQNYPADGSTTNASAIFHLEGVRLGGTHLTQGIRTACPASDVQIVNCHVERVRFDSCDHRDGTNGKTTNHPDLIQTYGGVKTLRIDGLTGYSSYQGVFLKEDNYIINGTVSLRRVNVEAVESTGSDGVDYAGHRMLWNYRTLPVSLDPGTVWIKGHANNGWRTPGNSSGTRQDVSLGSTTSSSFYWTRRYDPGHVAAESGSTYTPAATVATWDTDTEGWTGGAATGTTVIARDTTTKHDGAGSLSMTTATPFPASGYGSVRAYEASNYRNASLSGLTIACWVYIPEGTPGTDWGVRIGYYDGDTGSLVEPAAPGVPVPVGQWTLCTQTYTEPDLNWIRRVAIRVGANNVNAIPIVYIDTVTIGSISGGENVGYVLDPPPGDATSSMAICQGGASYPSSTGTDAIGDWATFSTGMTDKVYLGSPPGGEYVRADLVGDGYSTTVNETSFAASGTVTATSGTSGNAIQPSSVGDATWADPRVTWADPGVTWGGEGTSGPSDAGNAAGQVAVYTDTTGHVTVPGQPEEPPEPPGGPTIIFDSDDVLSGNRFTEIRFDLLDADENLIGTLGNVRAGGDLTWDAYAAVKGGGRITISDLGQGVIDWLNVRIRPIVTVHRLGGGDDPEGLEVPCGVWLCAAPQAKWEATGRAWDVELADKLSVLDQDIASGSTTGIVAYSAAAGANIVSLVQALIEETGETTPAIQPGTKTLAAPMVWEIGTTRLKIINDLLDAGNYFSLWCDPQGQYQVTPYVEPEDRVPVYQALMPFADTWTSLMAPSWTKDHDIYSIPNRYIVIGQGSGEEAALVAVATNEDPTSPYSHPSRGRWITSVATGVEATSQEDLDAIARRYLSSATSVTTSIDVSHAFLPGLLVNSVVRFLNHEADLDISCYVIRTTIKLDPVGLCSSTMNLAKDLGTSGNPPEDPSALDVTRGTVVATSSTSGNVTVLSTLTESFDEFATGAWVDGSTHTGAMQWLSEWSGHGRNEILKLEKVWRVLHIAAGPEYGAASNEATSTFSNNNPGTIDVDYHYESQASLNFIRGRGWDAVKVPLRWERLQRTVSGALDTTEMGRLTAFLDRCQTAGLKVIIDIHNYGVYYLYNGSTGVRTGIGTANLPTAAFADLWSRLATALHTHPAVYAYALMAEPQSLGGLTAAKWKTASQEAVTAIRAVDTTTQIHVGGWDWSITQTWVATNGSPWITDATGLIWYEGHHYWDTDAGGGYPNTYAAEVTAADVAYNAGTNPDALHTRVLTELRDFKEWCTSNGVKGIIGEWGWPRYTGAEAASWDALSAAYLNRLDAYQLDSVYWYAGEFVTDGGDLSVYTSPSPGTPLSTIEDAAATLELHPSITNRSGNVLALHSAIDAEGDTESSLVSSDQTRTGDIDFTVDMRTLTQLRAERNPPTAPNIWEVAWVGWNYKRLDAINSRFYYVLPKTVGFELGKVDQSVFTLTGGQRFLSTDALSYPIGVWRTIRIRQTGARIEVWIDGVLHADFTDGPGSLGTPAWGTEGETVFTDGGIVLYQEDSRVQFDNVVIMP